MNWQQPHALPFLLYAHTLVRPVDPGQGDSANTDLEGEPSGLAGAVSLGDVVDVAQWINPRQAVFTPQHADQQSDHRVTHRLLAGAMAQSPLQRLVIDNNQALDTGWMQHHSCGTGTFTGAVFHCSRIPLEHIINRSSTAPLGGSGTN